MLGYILRRLIQLVIVLVVGVVAFRLIHPAPGDPAGVMLGSHAIRASIE